MWSTFFVSFSVRVEIFVLFLVFVVHSLEVIFSDVFGESRVSVGYVLVGRPVFFPGHVCDNKQASKQNAQRDTPRNRPIPRVHISWLHQPRVNQKQQSITNNHNSRNNNKTVADLHKLGCFCRPNWKFSPDYFKVIKAPVGVFSPLFRFLLW